MQKHSLTRGLVMAAATAVAVPIAFAAPAYAADITVRGNDSDTTGQGGQRGEDVILDRTLADGSWEFLADGIQMDAPTPNDRAGVYWESAAGDVFPDSVSLDWTGTAKGEADEFADPAVVIFFDADGADGPEGRVALLHEEIYGENDAYLAGSSAIAEAAAPSDQGGSGSAFRGPLDEWAANLAEDAPDLEVLAVGVNLSDEGEDEGGSTGIVNEVTLGEDVYSFSNQDEVPPTPPTADVTGTVETARNNAGFVRLTFISNEQPENTTVGNKLAWRVDVNGSTMVRINQGFDDRDVYQGKFAKGTLLEVFKNGEPVRRYKIR